MKYALLVFFSLYSFALISKSESFPAHHVSVDSLPKTYAVVVGISDYQDPAIEDLRFADIDARKFSEFLQSEAGGTVNVNQIRLLLNEEATMARFAIALDWLWEVVGEGDKVYIYFSGHGDVEKKSITQPGYLLCWDAPAKVYMAGGTFSLAMLQDVISTLSLHNKAQVTFIADACRSGTLSGSSVGGSQITGSNLAKQYSNELKILSCQPDEYSIEGRQWGGGRGAFSYHLLNGLYGLADEDGSKTVNLREIRNYLEDHVPLEVAPQSQMPLTVGNGRDILVKVVPEFLDKAKIDQAQVSPTMSRTDSRGIEDDVLDLVDEELKKSFYAFKEALNERRFFEPEEDCAEYYYQQLIAAPELEILHSSVLRNYAAALQDDAQQVFNSKLQTDVGRKYIPKGQKIQRYRKSIHQIDRASELLGSKHYMFSVLQARKLFFEGYLISMNYQHIDEVQANLAISKFRQALDYQPYMPQTYLGMSTVFGHALNQPDSALHYAQLAFEECVDWVPPLTYSALMLSTKYSRFSEARIYLERAERIAPNSIIVLNAWGSFYFSQEKYPEATKYFKACLEIDPNYIPAMSNLGLILHLDGNYEEAIRYFERCVEKDPNQLVSLYNLGTSYLANKNFQDAESQFERCIDINPGFIKAYGSLADTYRLQSRFTEAEEMYRKAIDKDPTQLKNLNNLANLHFDNQKYDEAEELYLRCLDEDPNYFNVHFNLGNLYLEREQYNQAEKCFQACLAIDPVHTESNVKLATVYSKQENFEASERLLERGVEEDEDNINAIYELGETYLKQGRLDEAKIQFQKCLEIDNQYYNALFRLAGIADSQNQFDEALKYYDKCLLQKPKEVILYSKVGNIHYQNKDYDEAEQYFKKALEIEPADMFANTYLGLVYLKTNDLASAKSQFESAIKLDPTDEVLVKNLAYTYVNLKEFDLADEQYEKAILLDPKDIESIYMRARINAVLRQNDLAMKFLENALEAGYNNQSQIENDQAFLLLKKDKKAWSKLMKKYF